MEDADALQKMRSKAWEHFLELGLPKRKDEVYRYVPLRKLFAEKYTLSQATKLTSSEIETHILPECSQSVLVFVNGHFTPELSRIEALPKRMSAIHMTEAMRTYGSFLNNQSARTLKEETDPFATVNGALQRDGLFVYLPPKTIVDVPLQILHMITAGNTPMLIMPKVQLFAGSQSQISLVSTSANLSQKKYTFNAVIDFALEEDVHAHYTQIAIDPINDTWNFEALRATLKRNSTLKTIAANNGAATIRNDYRIALEGENAEALLNGISILKDKREAHTHVYMEHKAPYCRSLQLFKGVLNDFSSSSFEGKIIVRQAAQKTEAFQLNNNLLLSDHASANSKPNLEIFADDVKASHGSTVGQLDKEQIFYMKTRGFNEEVAKNLLVCSYCQEIIDQITIPSLKEKLYQYVKGYL
jgi:Fe-S cluster assembly protein SufD